MGAHRSSEVLVIIFRLRKEKSRQNQSWFFCKDFFNRQKKYLWGKMMDARDRGHDDDHEPAPEEVPNVLAVTGKLKCSKNEQVERLSLVVEGQLKGRDSGPEK